jgi:hypothetical protein
VVVEAGNRLRRAGVEGSFLLCRRWKLTAASVDWVTVETLQNGQLASLTTDNSAT